MHSTHFIYGYMASDIWLRTILIVRKETCCCHIGYSFRLAARILLYAPSHRQDSTYHSLCYTSRGSLAGTRNSSMGPPHEGSIWRPIAPWANDLTTSNGSHWAVSCSSQCSTTGITKAVVCVTLMHIKESLLLIGKSSHRYMMRVQLEISDPDIIMNSFKEDTNTNPFMRNTTKE